MEDKARLCAISILSEIDENKAFSNIRINQYFKKHNLDHTDRAFSTEIIYGTLRWKLKIDYVIQKFSKRNINELSFWVLNCLRICVYQVYMMDKVPEFAAVNQSVEICKLKDERAANFVNGVLRNMLRNRQEFDKIDIPDEFEKLTVEYSHPEWLVKRLVKKYGKAFAVQFMEKNNTPSELTVRVNTLKCTRNELKEILLKKDVEAADGDIDESLILKHYGMIEKSEEFNEGLFIIQDESSMLASKILDPKPDSTVMDLCSAPGGKTTHMAEIMKNKGRIIAFDIHEHKLKLVNQNAKKLGIDIIETFLRDASIYMEEYKNTADYVLVDAPCSGLGLIRKKPEIRWRVKESDLPELQKMQYKILSNASKYLKPGGALVYSTCTITEEENENLINIFLKFNRDYELEDISGYIPHSFINNFSRNGCLKLFPNLNGTDGFFIAKLRRKS